MTSHPDAPAALAERWTRLGGRRLFYREGGPSTVGGDVPTMVHVHGFAMSGKYLLPTAVRLADTYHTLVPDLPGYGRSASPPRTLDIPHLADAVLRFMDATDTERAILVGNSMGCPIICEIVQRAPDRVDRAVLVSPAGGRHSQPLLRALGQLALDGLLEPPRLVQVAAPDYLRFGPINTLRLFHALSEYPTLEMFLSLSRPSLAVLGSRDPLLPGRARVQQVAQQAPPHMSVVVIIGGAHALNFSHPGEVASVIRSWVEGRPIIDNPNEPGLAHVHRVGTDQDV